MFSKSTSPCSSTSLFLRHLLYLAVAMVLLAGTAVGAEEGKSRAPFFPTDYGKIVFRVNVRAPQQIYIIGQCHRSAISGRVRPDTIKVQAEIYRIGEWLIREKNVALLLPEGFFQRASAANFDRPQEAGTTVPLDNRMLEARLGDPDRFVNADLLLNDSYDIRLGQVENEQLYRDIRRLLRQASQNNSLSLLAKLGELQDERTAAMLQNIPEIVDEAYRTGQIDNRRAMFTIGLAHLGEIIRCLQRGTLYPSDGQEPAENNLKLLERGYGVTVIIPRTLAENEQTLRLARLTSH